MHTIKSISVIILLIFIGNVTLNAQTLKERIAAKKAALEASLAQRSTAGSAQLDPNISQDEVAAQWSDGTYKLYRFNGSACLEDGTTTLKFNKVGGKVVSLVQGGDGNYKADEDGKSEFVRYFKSEGSWNIVFTDKWAFIFTNGRGDDINGKYFIERSGKYADAQMVRQYLIDSKVNQEAELAVYASNEAAAKNKAEAERKAEWSIEGKKVSKIEVTNISAPYAYGYYRPFSFQIKATLSSGKTISTKDGGFWSDYTINYKNGNVDKLTRTIQATEFIKDDKIIIEIQSKYDSSIKATADVVMDYNEDLFFSYNAKNWGTTANDYKLEVKQVAHAVTGKALFLVKITDLDGYGDIQYMKIDASKTIHVTTDGANGYKTVGDGNETGPGANAGNGGNITVIKDPSVRNFNINYTLKGGIGGAGTYGYNRGANGRDGTYREEVRTLNL